MTANPKKDKLLGGGGFSASPYSADLGPAHFHSFVSLENFINSRNKKAENHLSNAFSSKKKY